VFRRLIRKLQVQVRLIRIEEAVGRILRRDLPDDPCVAFTFDDGFAEQYSGIAPVLEEAGINAAFFMLPGFIDGDESFREELYQNYFRKDGFLTSPKAPMSWEQVIDLHRRGHVIGSHGMTHMRLREAPAEEVSREIRESREIIERHTSAMCEWFAYPSGGQHDISEAAVREAKRYYRVVFSQSDYRRYFSFNGEVGDRRHLERNWPGSHVRYFLSSIKK